MRGIHSVVDDIRRNVFKEVAIMAYSGGNYVEQMNEIPFKIVNNPDGGYRGDVFLERAIVSERVRLACGLPLRPIETAVSAAAGIKEAAEADDKFFELPLVNIMSFACNACPSKRVRISDSCQGCLSHPCMAVCPKDAIYVDSNNKSHIDQDKCIKCNKCVNQCPYNAVTRIDRPCAVACGMDAIISDERGCAKIDYDKCVSCGMCLVNCPFAAIADKSQIFQVINNMVKGKKVIACVAPAFVGQFGKEATPAKLKEAMKMLGFADVVEVAIGADLCTIEEAEDFLKKVPAEQPFMATSCCPAWSMMAKKLFPQFKEYISMALTPMVITARMVKKQHPDAKICFIGPCAAKKLEANRESVRSDVDYVLTFEELQGIFDAKAIDFTTIEAEEEFGMEAGSAVGRGFAIGGGVANAVVEAISHIDPDAVVKVQNAMGLHDCKQMLMLAKRGKLDGFLLEGMGCPGGCVAGAGTIAKVKDTTNAVGKFSKAAKDKSALTSPYKPWLDEVLEHNVDH